jgi:hypothetical protein
MTEHEEAGFCCAAVCPSMKQCCPAGDLLQAFVAQHQPVVGINDVCFDWWSDVSCVAAGSLLLYSLTS